MNFALFAKMTGVLAIINLLVAILFCLIGDLHSGVGIAFMTFPILAVSLTALILKNKANAGGGANDGLDNPPENNSNHTEFQAK